MNRSQRLRSLIKVYLLQGYDDQLPSSFLEAVHWTIWGPQYYLQRRHLTNFVFFLIALLLVYLLVWPSSLKSQCPSYPGFAIAHNRLLYCTYNGDIFLGPHIVKYSNSLVSVEGTRCGKPWAAYVSKFIHVMHNGVETPLDQTSSVDLQRFLLTNEASPVPPNCFVS